MADVGVSNIHGHIFKLFDDVHFVAYEFEEGAVNNLSSCSADFIVAEGLQDIFGLQIRGESTDDMVEFDLTGYGTVMMKQRDAQHGAIFFTTG